MNKPRLLNLENEQDLEVLEEICERARLLRLSVKEVLEKWDEITRFKKHVKKNCDNWHVNK